MREDHNVTTLGEGLYGRIGRPASFVQAPFVSNPSSYRVFDYLAKPLLLCFTYEGDSKLREKGL